VKKEDPLAGKSKIWLVLNPQPIARQTAAERRQQQEDRVDLGGLGTKNYSFVTAVGEARFSLIQGDHVTAPTSHHFAYIAFTGVEGGEEGSSARVTGTSVPKRNLRR
jgi:hypothetical protein